MKIQLHHGDCLEFMKTLPAGGVDAVITDLPYGTTACKWDSIIPFEPMWEAVKHVLKPNGVFVTTASQPFTSKLIISNLDWFRQEIIWDKVLPVGFLDANRRHLRVHENIILFSPIGYPTFNPQKTKRGAMHWKGGAAGNANDVYHAYGPRKSFNCEYYPTSIATFSNGDRTRPEVGFHPTQKPVSLYEYLIRTYTNANETVLDMCMGSGTTGVACAMTGRNFIGCELDEGYFKIAEKRINDALQQPPLFPQ